MNAKQMGWARRYQASLHRFVKLGPAASLQPALRLGRQALALGLETPDMAKVHKQCLLALESPGASSVTRHIVMDRVKSFFAESNVPIEKTHTAALKNEIKVNQLTERLRRRTFESAVSTRRLKRGIARRQAAEAALKKSGKDRDVLLEKSNRSRNRLRLETHGILSAQEDGRLTSSRLLQDEIAQTLLAINIRLLALKSSIGAGNVKFEKEVVETQRLVKQSFHRIRKLAHQFGGTHEK